MSSPPDPQRVEALVVRANNWIGDVVMASPALHALRVHYDRARLAVVARPNVLAALEGSSDLDEIVLYDPREAHRGLSGRVRLVSDLRRCRFDLAVSFQKAFEAAALFAAAGIPRRFGYASDRRGWLLTDAVAYSREVMGRHHAQAFLDLAASAGAEPRDRTLRFPLSPADRASAAHVLESAGIATGEPIVSVHPGASKLPRAWHPSRFGLLAREAARMIKGRAVVLGSRADEPLGRAVVEAGGGAVIDLVGRTSVREMAGVFERSRVFLGSDSGPMHVASAVGTPVLAIFGPGQPEKTAPFVDPQRYEIVTLRFPCSPCRQDFFRECEPAPTGKPYCIEEISVVRAIGALEKLIEKTR